MPFIKEKISNINERVACIILAGGQGIRLFPLTQTRCKPAVSFGGRYRLIDIPISNSLNSNLKNIFVISQYFSSDLNEHLKTTYSLDQFQGGELSFLTPEERPDGKIWYEGTADAVRKNLSYLKELPIEYFLILSGDQLYNMDFRQLIHFAKYKNADLTIAALPVRQEAASRLGLLNINDQSDVVDFYEKPKNPALLKRFQLSDTFMKQQRLHMDSPCFLASMGIYAFKRSALIQLLEKHLEEDFGQHLIPIQIKKGKTAAFLHQGYWEDIGTITSFYDANLALTKGKLGLNFYNEVLPIYAYNHHLPGAHIRQTKISDSIICDGTIIEAQEVCHSIIGVRSLIQAGTTIRNAILLGNESYAFPNHPKKQKFSIGRHCFIERAIIDEDVIIGNHVKLTNTRKIQHYDGDKVYIRDGIIIVTKGAVIPDHFTL